MTPQSNTIIELSGHIIDSLTLAKVIDRVQAARCQYQITDLQIGQMKNDISTAQISLWADSDEVLNELLTDLKTYGARPVAESSVSLAACPADGALPEGAYVRHNPPAAVLYQGQWLPVRRQGFDMTIVVAPETKVARFKMVRNLEEGDMVVLGQSGVKILPLLESHA